MRMSDWSSDVCSSGLRASGGHLDSKGDPRESHSFAELVKASGGTIPDTNRPEDIRPGLGIYGPGEYQAKKPTAAIAPPAGGKAQGVGGRNGSLTSKKHGTDMIKEGTERRCCKTKRR